ncbi:iron-sulfur cluster assembly 1 homolog, mitochondrial isoform X1 [Saimiri boliviensis]|uniref:iron-sulfur cluster assembly 1 homolog, mitochondrial isoform X1 n=1 Tax=Saimiri boliviensis TaxID=27679 RepID=UPI003D76DA82
MSASLVRATVRAVSKRKLQPTRAALTLTPAAVNKIKQLLKDKPEHVGVKVGVRTRGCNGLSYTLEYTKTKGDSDEEVIQDDQTREGSEEAWLHQGRFRTCKSPHERLLLAGSLKRYLKIYQRRIFWGDWVSQC